MRRILPFLFLSLLTVSFGSMACQNIERASTEEGWYRAVHDSGWRLDARPVEGGIRFTVSALDAASSPAKPFAWAEAVLEDGERIPFRWEGEDLVLTLPEPRADGAELRVWEWRSNEYYAFPYPGN